MFFRMCSYTFLLFLSSFFTFFSYFVLVMILTSCISCKNSEDTWAKIFLFHLSIPLSIFFLFCFQGSREKRVHAFPKRYKHKVKRKQLRDIHYISFHDNSYTKPHFCLWIFYGISTFVDYLMLKLFLYKSSNGKTTERIR